MSPTAEPTSPNLFAPYAPRPADQPRTTLQRLVIRPSLLADTHALAEIAWQRGGGELASYVARFHRDLSNRGAPLDALWLTADLDGHPVGYGKVSLFQPDASAPPNAAPPGYYLGGVTVRPEHRRMGIGFQLTRERLAWIADRAGEAFYVVNALNRASIDLHARFGFVEQTRDFVLPEVSFTGGEGILFRVELAAAQFQVMGA